MIALARLALPTLAAMGAGILVARGLLPLTPWDVYQAAVLLLGLSLASRGRNDAFRERWGIWAAGLLGVLAAIGLLGKFNVGLLSAATAAAVAWVLVRPGWRGLAVMTLAFGGSTVVLLAATGQSPFEYPRYLQLSLEIATGYSASHGIDFEGQLDWALSSGVALSALVLAALLVATRGWPARERIVVVLVMAGTLFVTLKSGFVRDRYIYFFTIMPVLAFGVFVGRLRGLGLTVLVATVLIATTALRLTPAAYLDVGPSVAAFAEEAGTALDQARRRAAEERTAFELRSDYLLPPAAEALLAGHTVHIEPFEAGMAAGYRSMTWRPIPVFQLYSAYTLALDQANTEFLMSEQAPERILRWTPGTSPTTIDGRSYYFDSPAAKVAILCRYVPLRSEYDWQILARSTDRCGPVDWFAEVETTLGSTVPVPWRDRPGTIVVASIEGVGSTIWDRAEALLLKSPPWWINFGPDVRYRLVPGTANSTLLMGVPDSLGWPPPFGLSGYAGALSITDDGGARRDPIVIRFGSIPIGPAGSPDP
jgi:hypothetical protein